MYNYKSLYIFFGLIISWFVYYIYVNIIDVLSAKSTFYIIKNTGDIIFGILLLTTGIYQFNKHINNLKEKEKNIDMNNNEINEVNLHTAKLNKFGYKIVLNKQQSITYLLMMLSLFIIIITTLIRDDRLLNINDKSVLSVIIILASIGLIFFTRSYISVTNKYETISINKNKNKNIKGVKVAKYSYMFSTIYYIFAALFSDIMLWSSLYDFNIYIEVINLFLPIIILLNIIFSFKKFYDVYYIEKV